MSPLWSSGLVALALLSSGVVYGTDVFFALVARPALRRVDEASLTQVLGHLHAVADARMPVVGVKASLREKTYQGNGAQQASVTPWWWSIYPNAALSTHPCSACVWSYLSR